VLILKTTIYFIRHCESDITIKNDILRPLTVSGKSRAMELIKIFAGIDIDLFYSSPYKRTIETIKPLSDKYGKAIIEINDLRERKVDDTWIEDFDLFSKMQWNDFEYKLSIAKESIYYEDRI
jgi:2,3-bisphosphoglycerate-dependent phosphoglycerate mutase